MIKIKIYILFVLMGFMFVFGCGPQVSQQVSGQPDKHNDMLTGFPMEDLSNDEIDALSLTINDEFKAEATYQKVLDKFGEVRPFSNIINAEKKHSDALAELFVRYSLSIPANDWYEKVPEFASVQEACRAGVDAEIENVALYDELFEKVDNQDIISVFTSLRDASEYNHLPAFERCADR